MNDDTRQLVLDIAEAASALELQFAALRQKIYRLEAHIASERGAPDCDVPDTRLLADLGLSKRCLNILQMIGASQVRHIDRLPDAELLKLNNFGSGSKKELRQLIGRPKQPYVTLVQEEGFRRYRLPKAVLDLAQPN